MAAVSDVKSAISTISDIGNLFTTIRSFNLPTDDKIKRKVLLLDFDDTSAKSGHPAASHLGGLAWRNDFRKCIEELKIAGAISNTPIFEYVTLFIAKSVNVNAVQDKKTAEAFEELERSGFDLMIFTARGRSGENAWYGLNIGGIDEFTAQQMQKAGLRLTPLSNLPEHKAVYKNSMIFAQNVKKDILIADLIEKKVLDPAAISCLGFVDDKLDQVEMVKKAADGKVPFVGVHYTSVQLAEKTEYDLLKATIQLVNLFATGKFLEKEAVEAKATEFKATRQITPKDYFKDVIVSLDKFFVQNGLNKAYKDHEEFFQTVQSVARERFRTP